MQKSKRMISVQKLIKSLWLLGIFQLNDNEELFDTVRKVLSQNNKNFYKNIAVGVSIGCNKLFTLANEFDWFV